jgi:hypothetical protein
MKHIIKISLLIGFTLTIYNSAAQEKINGGSGGFMIGGKQYNTSSYNHFMSDGVDDLMNNLIRIGGGGYGIFNNWIVGGYGFYQGGDNKSTSWPGTTGQQQINYSLEGGGGYLTLGYVAFKKDNLLLFPKTGIGLESLSLNKVQKEDLSFQSDEYYSSEYTWNSLMLDLGVGLDWFPFENGMKLGLRAGYNLSLSRDADWKHSGGDFTNDQLPENDLDGFYLQLLIGGGDFSKQ